MLFGIERSEVNVVQIYRAFSGYAPLAFFGLVVAFLALAWRTISTWRAGTPWLMGLRLALLEVVVVGNVLAYLALTLVPGHSAPHSVNVIPFYEVYEEMHNQSGATAPLVEIVGNTTLLTPFAIFAQLRWPLWQSMRATLLSVGCLALAAEFLQFALGLGRIASVTDVLLPLIGAVPAWAVGYGLRKWAVHASRRNPSPVKI